MTEPIFLNSKEIANVLKIGVRDIKKYVDEYSLPAFQERRNGSWKARREALLVWAAEHEKRFVFKVDGG